jgi:hypothetical protein
MLSSRNHTMDLDTGSPACFTVSLPDEKICPGPHPDKPTIAEPGRPPKKYRGLWFTGCPLEVSQHGLAGH